MAIVRIFKKLNFLVQETKRCKGFFGKRGVFFSTDALLALLIIFFVLLFIFPTKENTSVVSEAPQDILDSLSILKVGEINNSNVSNMILGGDIANLNNSLLEQIGEFYVSDIDKARLLASSVLDKLNLSGNMGIWYGDDLIFSKNLSSYEDSDNVGVSRQLISGIQKGDSPTGFVSKAWLNKISGKKTSVVERGDFACGGWQTWGWGDYCGWSIDNEIRYSINIPENATIENAFWLAEPSWVNQPADLYVNGVQVFSGSLGYFTVINITSNLVTGNNIARLVSTHGGEDGASHIVVEYSIADLQTFEQITQIPFHEIETESVLRYEKALFVPSTIINMSVVLNITRDTRLFIQKGANTYLVGTKMPNSGFVQFNNSEIDGALVANGLSYSDLSEGYFFFIVEGGVGTSGQSIELGSGSYVSIGSAGVNVPFGSIDVTQEVRVREVSLSLGNTFYRHLVWTFSLPLNSIPLFADWQLGWLSMSSTTEQEARANGVVLYDSPPDPYIQAFSRFGYTPGIAEGVFVDGANNFTLDFGTDYGVSNESSYGSLTYFIRSFVNYGDSFDKAEGGTLNVTFEDDSTVVFVIGNGSDPWDPSGDAIDDAVERLFAQFDAEGDGKIDLILNPSSFELDTLDVSGVPNLWSTEVQARWWT